MTLNRIFVSYEHDYKVVNIYLFHHSITRSFFFSVRHLLVKKIVDMPTLCGCLFKKIYIQNTIGLTYYLPG